MKTLLIKKKEMNSIINSSKETYKFLNMNFSCQICNEIPNNPLLLKCEHLLCENCLYNFQKEKNNNKVICPFCFYFSEINFSDNLKIKLLIDEIKGMCDKEFYCKYGNFSQKNYNKSLLFKYMIDISENEIKKKIENLCFKNNFSFEIPKKRKFCEVQKDFYFFDFFNQKKKIS